MSSFLSGVSFVLHVLHRCDRARATPDMKITTMPQAGIKPARDTGGCSMFGAKLEVAVEATVAELVGGASVVVMMEELVPEVGGGCVLLTCT